MFQRILNFSPHPWLCGLPLALAMLPSHVCRGLPHVLGLCMLPRKLLGRCCVCPELRVHRGSGHCHMTILPVLKRVLLTFRIIGIGPCKCPGIHDRCGHQQRCVVSAWKSVFEGLFTAPSRVTQLGGWSGDSVESDIFLVATRQDLDSALSSARPAGRAGVLRGRGGGRAHAFVRVDRITVEPAMLPLQRSLSLSLTSGSRNSVPLSLHIL
jgi:hypothetical protein